MKPLRLEGVWGSVEIHPLGATVLSWVPPDGRDRLFVSPQAVFREGKGIRGGIPVCWPWFAGHPESEFPSHGVARTRIWRLEHSSEDEARWSLTDDAQTRRFTPPFRYELLVRATDRLEVTLTHQHRGDSDLEVSGALHSYLAADRETARVEGVEGLRCFDKLTGEDLVLQGPQTFETAVDRIVYDAGPLQLGDLRIEGSGSDAVLWNPGGGLGDLSDAASRNFVCIEAAQIRPVTLQPGDRFSLSTVISG